MSDDDGFGDGIEYPNDGDAKRPRRKKAAKKSVRRKVTRTATKPASKSSKTLFDDEDDDAPEAAAPAAEAPSANPSSTAPSPKRAPEEEFQPPSRSRGEDVAERPTPPPYGGGSAHGSSGRPQGQTHREDGPRGRDEAPRGGNAPYSRYEQRGPQGRGNFQGGGFQGGGPGGPGAGGGQGGNAYGNKRRGNRPHPQRGSGPSSQHTPPAYLPVDDEEMNEAILAQLSDEPPIDLVDYQRMTLRELQVLSRDAGFREVQGMKKQDLLFRLLRETMSSTRAIVSKGVIEVMPDGFGFLRSPEYSYLSCPDDVYVSPSQIRRFSLKTGHTIEGRVRAPKDTERYFAMLRVDKVNDRDPLDFETRQNFEDLVPLYPDERLKLEYEGSGMEMRVVDLVAPIGKGQRAVIVAPPRTGKTILLQKIANSVLKNNPEVYLIVLLIDERPEEVTDMQRTIKGERYEIVSSTFDEPAARHIQVAEMVIEKARRMVEYGEDVVILLDSITRLARAYNSEAPHSGKILTGGVDSSALQRPKRFFGAARNVENGGSLTILGTALIDTGSKMDEVVFEEFKGTGNSELHLDRKLSERRVWPAIDINRSGTRKEDLLFTPEELKRVWMLRKILNEMSPVEAMELLVERMRKSRSNVEFLLSLSLA